ncbi:MAG: DUF4153 domain-containing protein [Candidatus Azobacteroides sp.]|nr:DUF4153 domain-containing protein [Candidatus Azobacteroides sp.]
MKLDIGLLINNSFRQIKDNLITYPVEIFLCLVAGVFLSWYFPDITTQVTYGFALAVPTVLFFNKWASYRKNKAFYFLGSFIFLVLYSVIPWAKWIEPNGKGIYFKGILVIVWCFFFFIGREKDNVAFAGNTVRLFLSIFLAGVYTGILAGLFELIYYTCTTLFGISDELTVEFRFYVCFFVVFPQIFLSYYNKEEFTSNWLSRIIIALFTPAAIIYTIILYVYFVSILITFSFPEGRLAYMAGWYMGITILLQICYLLSDRKNKLYDWFYKRLPYLFFFPLIMYALSVSKRIMAYGFTEDRCMLIVIGIVYLIYILFFIFPKTAKYILLFPVIILFTVLSVFTPYIGAYELSLSSQQERVSQMFSKYEMLDGRGYLKNKEDILPLSSTDYKSFFSSLEYLSNKGFKIKEMHPFSLLQYKRNVESFYVYDLRSFIPEEKSYPENTRITPYRRLEALPFTFEMEEYDFFAIIKGGKTISINDMYQLEKVSTSGKERDSIKLFGKETNGVKHLIGAHDLSADFGNNFKDLGIRFEIEDVASLPVEKAKALFTLKGKSYKIIFSGISYEILPDTTGIEIKNYTIHTILFKKHPF